MKNSYDNVDSLRVDVYRNLNKNCLSVMCRENGNSDYGQVIKHVDSISLSNVDFVVSEKSRERAKDQEKRNVHAYVRGIVDKNIEVIDGRNITYNPFKYDYFIDVDNNEYVDSAERVTVTTNGVRAKGVTYKSATPC